MRFRGISLVFLVLLSSCYTPVHIKQSSLQQLPMLQQGKSRLVFMRSALHGGNIPLVLYEIRDGVPEYFGAMRNRQKFVYDVDPGKHLFMSVGSGKPYFMQADLAANKSYYVTMRPGGWPRIGFAFAAVRAGMTSASKTDKEELQHLLSSTVRVENTSRSAGLAESSQAHANSLYAKYWGKWRDETEHSKMVFTVNPSDAM